MRFLLLLFLGVIFASRPHLRIVSETEFRLDGSAPSDAIVVGDTVWFTAESSSQLVSYRRNKTRYYELNSNNPSTLTSDGEYIYFASFNSGDVGSFDISTGEVDRLLYLRGTAPSSLFVEGKYLYITLYYANELVVYNLNSGEIEDKYELAQGPTDIIEYNGDICIGGDSGIDCYSDFSSDPYHISGSKLVTSFIPGFNRSLCYTSEDRNLIGCFHGRKRSTSVYLGSSKGPVAAVGGNNEELYIAEFDGNALAILDEDTDIDEYRVFGRDTESVYGKNGGPSTVSMLNNGNLVVSTWSQNSIVELEIC